MTVSPDADFREFTIRVYYEDTDAGGVVFYANYLKFYERARTEWLRASGVSQERLRQEQGVVFVVRHTAVDYLRPARLDDLLLIRSRIDRLGTVAVQFFQEVRRLEAAGSPKTGAPELLSQGRIKVGCVDQSTFRPAPIPPSIRTAFQFTSSNNAYT